MAAAAAACVECRLQKRGKCRRFYTPDPTTTTSERQRGVWVVVATRALNGCWCVKIECKRVWGKLRAWGWCPSVFHFSFWMWIWNISELSYLFLVINSNRMLFSIYRLEVFWKIFLLNDSFNVNGESLSKLMNKITTVQTQKKSFSIHLLTNFIK